MGKRHRKRNVEFEQRDENIISVLKVYAEQRTIPTKFRQLELLAPKLLLDVLTDIQDENCQIED